MGDGDLRDLAGLYRGCPGYVAKAGPDGWTAWLCPAALAGGTGGRPRPGGLTARHYRPGERMQLGRADAGRDGSRSGAARLMPRPVSDRPAARRPGT